MGDEFLTVVTETTVEGTRIFCERLRTLIKNYEFKNEDFSRHLTVSIGFAITEKGCKHIDARTLVRLADRALYDAKDKGRDRVEHYDLSKEKLGDLSSVNDFLRNKAKQ